MIKINDALPDDHTRTAILMPLVEASIGTAGKGFNFAPAWRAYEEARATAWRAYEEARAAAARSFVAACLAIINSK